MSDHASLTAGPAVPETSASVAALQISAWLHVLTELGLDAARICARAGLARSRLSDPRARIPMSYDQVLWDAAIAEAHDPALALRVAAKFELGVFGSFEYLLRNCDDVADMVQQANAFMALLDDLARLELQVEGEQAVLALSRRGAVPLAKQGVECVFALLRTKSGALAPSRAPLLQVTFAHAGPVDVGPYEGYFGCPVHFNAGQNALVLDVRVLSLHWPGDPRLRTVLEEHARIELERVPRFDPVVCELREQLLRRLAEGHFDVTSVARGMRMSERSLRRRLRAAGTGYQEELDGVRAQLAQDLLRRPELDVEWVAEQLGFTDPSTLYRSFKRWTGLTPAQFRAQGSRQAGVKVRA